MTEDSRRDSAAKAIERLQRHPMLGNFAVPLTKLSVPRSEDLARTFERFAAMIGASTETFVLTFRVAHDSEVRSWSLEAGPDGCTMTNRETAPPDVELLLDEQTCRELLRGSLSPLEAFGRGRMRVRGDVRVARKIARRLHNSIDSKTS